MSMWTAVLICGAGAYLLKLMGMSVPERVLEKPRIQRIAELIPVVLLAALVAVQVFASTNAAGHPTLALDARLVGLSAAVIALLLRASFLVVVVVAAVAAALVRLL